VLKTKHAYISALELAQILNTDFENNNNLLSSVSYEHVWRQMLLGNQPYK